MNKFLHFHKHDKTWASWYKNKAREL
jgi:hypothetical protein